MSRRTSRSSSRRPQGTSTIGSCNGRRDLRAASLLRCRRNSHAASEAHEPPLDLSGRGAAALVMLASSATARTLNGFELKGSLVPPDQILHGGPPKDPNPGDRRAQVRLAERCCARCRRTGARPRPQRGGESVPGRILNWHEIVNDRLGDEPTSIMNTVFFVS